MTDIMCMAVGIAAFIGFVLGMLLCMKAIDPMKEWRVGYDDGFEAAKKIFDNSKKWFNFGWDAGFDRSKKWDEGFEAGYDAALKRKESTDEA